MVMLGLGVWEFFVDTMFFRGNVKLFVGETQDGGYDIGVQVPGVDVPPIEFAQLQAEGNTVSGLARTAMLTGKDIPFSFTFEGETANGFLKVPFIGKLVLKNGRKIG